MLKFCDVLIFTATLSKKISWRRWLLCSVVVVHTTPYQHDACKFCIVGSLILNCHFASFSVCYLIAFTWYSFVFVWIFQSILNIILYIIWGFSFDRKMFFVLFSVLVCWVLLIWFDSILRVQFHKSQTDLNGVIPIETVIVASSSCV